LFINTVTLEVESIYYVYKKRFSSIRKYLLPNFCYRRNNRKATVI